MEMKVAKQINIDINTSSKVAFGPWSHDKNIYRCVEVGKWKSETTGHVWDDDYLSLPENYEDLCKGYESLIGTRWRAINVGKESRLSDYVVFEKVEE